jgi:predicted ATPase
MQLAGRKDRVRLIGIEEPETALHLAASGALMGAMREAADSTQILLTTHSPDLLDNVELDKEDLLVLRSNQGTTVIGPADPSSLESIRNHLFSPGDLLRMDQLQSDLSPKERQTDLCFD